MWKIKQAFYAIENNFHGNIQMIYQKYFIGSKILFLVLTFLFYPESSDEFLVVVKILCSDTYLGLCKCDHVIWNPLASLCSNTPYIPTEVCTNNSFSLQGSSQRNHLLMPILSIVILPMCFHGIFFTPWSQYFSIYQL